MANILSTQKRAEVLALLSEGMSMRAISRVTGVARQTVIDLVVDLGTACASFLDRVLRDLPCTRLELDEQWSFIGCKQKHVGRTKRAVPGMGDAWLWVAIDAETKLVATWMLGPRDAETAKIFGRDLAARLTARPQITTDGLKAYLEGIEEGFGSDVDFAQVVKTYGTTPAGNEPAHRRYSPATCTGITKNAITGNPDMGLAGTSYVERFNLETRMHNRRFTRLTNAFSKKLENHAASIAIQMMIYNFVRIHGSLRITPAMAAGITDHPWEMEHVIDLLDVESATVSEAA